MISINEVRQEVVAAFQAAHELTHPDTLVNYPNRNIVDIERQKDPFVVIDLDLSKVKRAAIGEKEILVPGTLRVYYYFRDGTGTVDTCTYTDALNENLSTSQIGSVLFGVVKPFSIQNFPGWKGTLNQIPFDIVAPLSD